MAANEALNKDEDFVYRISTSEEWEELQRSGATFGGNLDQSTGCFHLSKLDQSHTVNGCIDAMSYIFELVEPTKQSINGEEGVQSTLLNFFLNVKEDLYLLQIDAKKLGNGLIYEAIDDTNVFPHFYGPSRSFSPLPFDAVTKGEKLTLLDGKFKCSFLS